MSYQNARSRAPLFCAALSALLPNLAHAAPPAPPQSEAAVIDDARVSGYMRGAKVQAQKDEAAVAQALAAAQDAERRASEAEARAAQAQQREAQALSVLKSPQVQGVIGALNQSQGNVDAAAQALTDKMVQERAARMASRAFWTRGPKVEGNTFNLSLHLVGGGRASGDWGPAARTDFGLRLDVLPFNFRAWAEAGAGLRGPVAAGELAGALAGAAGAAPQRALGGDARAGAQGLRVPRRVVHRGSRRRTA